MTPLTRAQRVALFRVFQRDFPNWISPGYRDSFKGGHVKVTTIQWRRFRRRVHPGPGCVMIEWRGMWLGIEPDGYTHS
jgi:hypothetical protein